jgi:hypothetical protein
VDADTPHRDDEAEGSPRASRRAVDATPITMFERNPMALVFSPFSPISGSCGAAWIGGAVVSVELVDATSPRFREAAESGIGWTEDPAKDAGLLRVGHAHGLDLLLFPALVNESPLRSAYPADPQIRV